jgi:hypothetical protein
MKKVSDELAVALIGYKDAIISSYVNVTESTFIDHGVEFVIGKKYVKVTFKPWHDTKTISKYTHSFIEKTTGDIWKASTHKAPAKNFPRGNVLNNDYPTLSWTGIS